MSDIADQIEINRLNAKIEALEGEVERLNAECCRCGQPTTAVCKAARDAEARAERLRVALEEIKADPVIAFAVAERALEEDKQ